MDASSDSQRHPSGQDAAVGVQLQQVSACLDGELSDAEFAALLQALDRQPGESARQSWTAYHLIGESLRGELVGHRGLAPTEFLSGVRDRLAAEVLSEGGAPSLHSPIVSQPMVRGKAANDAVFRWKMVAGLASVAAVMAVTWGVMGTGSSGVSGPVMAQRDGEVSAVVAVGAAPIQDGTTTVAVETPQGTIIRDARLQQLLADHRQNGMSALQMPAGFLRNATHDNARGR